MNNSLLDFAGLAALIVALTTLFKTLWSKKSEGAKQKLDIASQLQVLADAATARNIDLYDRVVRLESDSLETKGDLRLFANLFKEWIDGFALLKAQLRRKQIVPVWEPSDSPELSKLLEKYGDKE